ncbi:hypothetical protein A2311_02415 [candidate division WOR-1 bacterium RIFOXYB2_FULL_48_7]|uniref:Uncharacterized protein n=1 Tax=candidate division WOR-1 bacterium RIFOXYB2_FULL_48_7 TaxID=1802583 RepID=A0A1F4TUH5_UNCSA|nr:MAG: hypothetical protein A2311_02415 [candidate division WOR-1 bacterium RIFOXYB2_FULL_48_7]
MPITTHILGGANACPAALRYIMGRGPAYVHRLALEAYFPKATDRQIGQVIDGACPSLFVKNGFHLLQPALSWLRSDLRVMVNSDARFAALPPALRQDYFPAITLESRSNRARFWVTADGRGIEYKGLTPTVVDFGRINENSNQVEGLMAEERAAIEYEGLTIINGLKCCVTPLGSLFGDLQGHAQLVRGAVAGELYLPWIRADKHVSSYELLAQLEGLSLEQFLWRGAQRFGEQARRLHQAGRTMASPFRAGSLPREPYYSSLHKGNVEIHGNIIDLEGMKTFAMVGDLLGQQASVPVFQGGRGHPATLAKLRGRTTAYYARLCDLQRFLGGRNGEIFETSAALNVFSFKESPLAFAQFLSGVFCGYYGQSDATQQAIISNEFQELTTKMHRSGYYWLSIEQTINILDALDNEYGAVA